MLSAIVLFLVTLILVIWQPRGLGIGISASAGALLALLLGIVQWQDIPVVWQIVWNATLALIAIILISLILDESGFFHWIALHVSRWGRGKGSLLFVYIIFFGAIASAFFANDGAVLILTPIVIAILRALRLSPATTLAFIMAAGFIVDTASLPLVISNLVNIISADFFALNFIRYAQVIVPVNFVAILSSLIVLYLFYRQDIPASYELDSLIEPKQVIVDKRTFVAGWIVLALLLLGFFILEPQGVPISAIAGVGALSLLLIASLSPRIKLRPILRGAPWQIVIFSLAMYLVVYGLKNAGATDYLAKVLAALAQEGLMIATVGTGLLSAFLSSIMNNLPTVLIQAIAIDGAQTEGMIREAMVFANVIGSDLGPKITPIGSLATLLWLHVLAQKDIRITWGYYFKVGIVLTLPVLLSTLLALALWLPCVS